MDDCTVKAETCQSLFDQVKYYILSSSPEIGLELGLTEVKSELCEVCYIVLHTRYFICEIICAIF